MARCVGACRPSPSSAPPSTRSPSAVADPSRARKTACREGPPDVKDHARTVVIGAGIVGASAAYHLAELGEPDALVLDQGPLFETGGSRSRRPLLGCGS